MNRKGLLAVVLATGAVLFGGLSAQYYTWSITYTAEPLMRNTATVTLDIGTRSGATNITPVTKTEMYALKNLPKKADLNFQIFADKDLDDDGTNDLVELFSGWYHFKVTFKVMSTNGEVVVGSDCIEFNDTNGDGVIDTGEVSHNPAVISLNPDTDYDNDGTTFGEGPAADIEWTIEGTTGAVTSSVSEKVPVAVYVAET